MDKKSPRARAKPRSQAATVGDAKDIGIDTALLTPPFRQLYADIVTEIVALRGAATKADLTLAFSVAQSAEGEATARALALQAQLLGDFTEFRQMTRVAESQLRAKSGALGNLGLSGDRRGVSAMKQAAHAIGSGAVMHGSGKQGTGRWN